MLIHKELGIYKVKLPLPFRLNHINCYAIKGNSGWHLVDTGLNVELSRQVWQQFMTDQGITNRDIQAIYLTHYHIDHFGAAGWFQGFSGAPVFLSAIEQEAIHQNYLAINPEAIPAFNDIHHVWGVPPRVTEEFLNITNSLTAETLPFPKLNIIEPGNIVQLGDHRFRAILTPGHSYGHICYLNDDYGVLLSGDHLLQKITSNISILPKGDPDPLASYLQTLQDNLQLPIDLVLPAHGPSFTNVKERIHELLLHHEERLSLIKGLMTEGDTVYSICKKVFKKGLSVHDLRFAVSEIAAHLIYMVKRGELEVAVREGIQFFSKSN